MKLGLVMTIRNERAQLRPNLLYHHFVGVDQVYLYHDRCTDGSSDTVDDLPFVRIAPTTDRDQLRGRPESAYYIEHYNVVLARQALNAIHTLDLAAENDLDWLVHIDADELVCPHREQVSAGALKRFLEELDDEIECVRFPPFEVCSRRLEYGHVFAEETLSLHPAPKARGVCTTRSRNHTSIPTSRLGIAKANVRYASGAT